MSTGDIGEIRTRLDQGIDELSDAATPLETGRANAARILERTSQMEMTVSGMIKAVTGFFSNMQERVQDEVVAPYASAAERYKKAAGLIVSSVEGADNEDARRAGEGATTISERTDELLQAAKKIGQPGQGSIEGILTKLREVDALMDEFSTGVAGAIDGAHEIQTQNHGQTMEAAEAYLDELS